MYIDDGVFFLINISIGKLKRVHNNKNYNLKKSHTCDPKTTKCLSLIISLIGAPINKVKLANHRRQVLGVQETSLSTTVSKQ